MNLARFLPPAASPALALAVLLTGCQHAPPAVGQSSFAFVELPPEAAARPRAITDVQPLPPQQLVAARPIQPLASPVYPANALAAHAGAATVAVRITIAPTGRVSDITQSFATVSLPGPFAPDFRSAVDAAVSHWRFVPAHLQSFETVTEKGFTYTRVARDEPLSVQADVRFTFTASGTVSLTSPAAPSPR